MPVPPSFHQGEEVQQVSSGSTEAEGVKVGREYEEPEPEEEPEKEPEPEEAEEGAEGEGEVRSEAGRSACGG